MLNGIIINGVKYGIGHAEHPCDHCCFASFVRNCPMDGFNPRCLEYGEDAYFVKPKEQENG